MHTRRMTDTLDSWKPVDALGEALHLLRDERGLLLPFGVERALGAGAAAEL